jgi:hypothetical protein
MQTVASHGQFLIDLRIKNHMAMAELTQGRATKVTMDLLIASVNMTEALYRLGLGTDYRKELNAGLASLHAVASRGASTGKFILRAEEMKALNTVMELHDAQLEIATVKDIEKAVAIVENEKRLKKMVPINK